MIVECPECTGPFQLLDDTVAPLVQVACPHCTFRMILDFEAANDASLQEDGMGMTRGFASVEAYRHAAGSDLSPATRRAPPREVSPRPAPSPAAIPAPISEVTLEPPRPVPAPDRRPVPVHAPEPAAFEPEVAEDVVPATRADDLLSDLDLSDLDQEAAEPEAPAGVPMALDEDDDWSAPVGAPRPVEEATSASASRRRPPPAATPAGPPSPPPERRRRPSRPPPPPAAPPRGRYRGPQQPPPPPSARPTPPAQPVVHPAPPPSLHQAPIPEPGRSAPPRAADLQPRGGSPDSLSAGDSLGDSMLQRYGQQRGIGTYLLIVLVLLILAVFGLSLALHGTLNPAPLLDSLLG